MPKASLVRPLHERLALADAAAIGTVREVGLGRIRVDEATALFGAPGASFELKRAPSSPPPLEAGDRALLLLRGGRSPFVLVDVPEEAIRLADAEAESRWLEALRDTRAARDDPPALRDLYLGWLANGDAELRELGRIGLTHADAPFGALPDAVVAELVRDATDPKLDVERRRAAARVVLRTESGAALLLPKLPGDAESADPQLLLDAIQIGALRGEAGVDPLLARALDHPRDDVRRAALRMSTLAARGPTARPVLERVAAEDPDEDLRATALRALQRR